jgi:hypothetical protein
LVLLPRRRECDLDTVEVNAVTPLQSAPADFEITRFVEFNPKTATHIIRQGQSA